MKKKTFVLSLGCVLVLLLSTGVFAENDSIPLANEDCVKCHVEEVTDIDAHGALHKTEVGCTDCHAEHPPEGQETIAGCDSCHSPEDNAHYALQNCKVCHHPHHPRDMDFSKIDPVKPACLSCHPGPDEQMQAYPSKHAELDCKQCHRVHREATACLECHDPHSSKMTSADCKRCHQPHMPMEVTYGDDISSTFCAGCHGEVSKNLVRTKTKHRGLECMYCHKHRHKKAFGCDTCHGEPHDFDIHAGYPDCLKCHEDPHALTK